MAALEGVPAGAVALWDPVNKTTYTAGSGGGGGGSGGAVTIADGADVAQGATTDPAWTGTGSATEIGLQKAIALAAQSTNPVTVSWSGMSVSLTGTLPGFATAPAVVLDPSAKGQQPGSGSLSVVLASDQPALGAAKAQKQAGTLSAVGDTVVLAVDSYSTASLQLAALTGTPTGAAVIEATQDKSATWFPINMVPVAAGVTPTPTSTLAPGNALQNFEVAIGSFDSIRVRCTTAFSASQPVVLGAYTGGKSTRAGLLPSSNVIGKVGLQVGGTDVASGNPVPVTGSFSSTPAASELHLGEVGGSATKVSVTFGPTSSTTYTAGQVLMGTTAIAGVARVANGMGYLFGATLGLNVANTVQVDLFVFSSQPSGTYTAGGTFTLAAADLPKLSKVIHLDDWTAAGAALSFGQPLDKGPRLFRCDDTTATQSLWVVAVARGSITLASATDGVLTFRPARN